MLTHGTISPVLEKPHMIEELSPVAVGRSLHQHPASTHPEKRFQDLFIGLETGSVRLFKQYMKGKAYPFRPEQWPDVVLKGMEILNKNNWFPFCTFIVGLPGETERDTKESLDLLFALKGSKWCVVPTLFVLLEDSRLENNDSAKIFNLTDLQWEFFYTCCRYNLDFWRSSPKVQWKFYLGAPIYYYLIGRTVFGPKVKYPVLPLGHFPESLLRGRLYLDFSGRMESRFHVPERVDIPPERLRPFIPELPPASLVVPGPAV